MYLDRVITGRLANERRETIVINDCSTEEMVDFIYPDNLAVKYAAKGADHWQYTLDHKNDHDLIDIDGHLCVVTHYDGFNMATYGDFPTDKEMQAAYQDYQNREMAAEIARESLIALADYFDVSTDYLLGRDGMR